MAVCSLLMVFTGIDCYDCKLDKNLGIGANDKIKTPALDGSSRPGIQKTEWLGNGFTSLLLLPVQRPP